MFNFSKELHQLGFFCRIMVFKSERSMVKVSVIIPIYNVEQYIKRCLESIVNQTLNDIEIICVNDGTKDNSMMIVNEFAQNDKRIVIINQENKGLGAARNAGLLCAKGKYIGFVDSDDWVDIDFYEKLFNSAEENDADIVAADFIRKNERRSRKRLNLKTNKVFEDTIEKLKVCRTGKEGCVWNKIYKTALLKEYNLNFPEGKYYEDGLFTLRAVYYSKKLVTVTDTFYYYYINPVSIVKSGLNGKKLEDLKEMQKNILDFVKEKNIKVEDWYYKQLLNRVSVFGLNLYISRKSTETRRGYLFGFIPLYIKKL